MVYPVLKKEVQEEPQQEAPNQQAEQVQVEQDLSLQEDKERMVSTQVLEEEVEGGMVAEQVEHSQVEAEEAALILR